MGQQARDVRMSAQTDATDRRRATRRPLSTRVAVRTEKAIFFMESVDVSSTGIRVQSEVAIEPGTRCRLVPFFDDVARLFEASGTVVRSVSARDSQDAPHGAPHAAAGRDVPRTDMGIEFEPLKPAEMEALLAILRLADPPPLGRVARM